VEALHQVGGEQHALLPRLVREGLPLAKRGGAGDVARRLVELPASVEGRGRGVEEERVVGGEGRWVDRVHGEAHPLVCPHRHDGR
jgi:hypothetical protein